jgi:acetyl-CoA synthetase
VDQANLKDPSVYSRANSDEGWELFWEDIAKELDWIVPWEIFFDDSNAPFYRFFVGGRINASLNCIDRHLEKRRNKAAIVWEGEPEGETRTLTYQDLHREVSKFANVLKRLGVKKGDRVAIYLPMLPELPIAMLACARIGAVHSVVFAGFSSQALATRIDDAGAKVLVTCDGFYRRGKVIDQKKRADDSLDFLKESKVEHLVVLKRAGNPVEFNQWDRWWHELMADESQKCEAERMDAEDVLFIIYTSGTTGKPKGVVHGVGGYLVYTYATTKFIFDLKENDIFWCTADIGWITGHSYIVYGPLAAGSTVLIYEGAPDYPDKERIWDIIEKHHVTIFYTAPTAIRLFMKWGEELLRGHDLGSLRLLGSVGEPINPEAWWWYYRNVGNNLTPIVDTWFQTETGGIVITPIPSLTPLKPGSATKPFPGIFVDVFNEEGEPVKEGERGYLVIKRPWPGMLRTLFKDPERYKETYWKTYGDSIYFSGDAAKKDEDGYIWVIGRVDDAIKVAGHRLSTMELESVIIEVEDVAEAAVVSRPHEIKGSEIVVYATLKEKFTPSAETGKKVVKHIRDSIGAIATPGLIIFSPDLPKTRSGKIMRRVLRAVASRKETGDLSTLANPEIVEILKKNIDKEKDRIVIIK